MRQQELFNSSGINLKSLLQHNASNGVLFYKSLEVAKLLRLSGYQVYWLIWNCRLDALLVCGSYRIPWFSILDLIRDQQRIKRQYWAYKALTAEHDKKTIYTFPGSATAETAPEDYYYLPDLGLPDYITLPDLAMILRVQLEVLQVQRNWSDANLSWPEVYDYLIECEVVNLPVFRDRSPSIAAAKPLQLALF